MSFRETFTRDDQGKEDVQYDDSAFFTFAASIVLVIIIIILIQIVRRLLSKNEFHSNSTINCRCKICKKKLNNYDDKLKSKKINYKLYLLIFFMIIFSYLFYLSYLQIIKNTNNLKTFNPYEILEVNPDATEADIKSSYRRLARMYHPDRNQNNPQAKGLFILITKAYESLTDEVAKKNFELYGNPDGPGSMRLAVGLPSFVLNQENHMIILIIFLVLVVGVIPTLVWIWFSKSNKFDENGLQIGNKDIFYDLFNENTLLKNMPFVFGNALEFKRLNVRTDKIEELNKFYDMYIEFMPNHNKEQISIENKQAIALIYAYIYNKEFELNKYEEEINFILNNTPLIIGSMYEMIVKMRNLHMVDNNIKKFGYKTIRTILEFSQMISNRIAINNYPFLQLPYFTDARVRKLKENKEACTIFNDFNNNFENNDSFTKFLKLSQSDRRKFLSYEFNNDEIEEIDLSCETIPIYDVKIDVEVTGFGKEIIKNDLITQTITIERKNLPDNKNIGVLHSNSFPLFLEERVALLVVNVTNVIYEKLIVIDKKVTKVEFKSMASNVGTIPFKFELISLNYKGLEYKNDTLVNVKESSEERRKFIKSIEDREPKKLELSYFQQMMNEVFPQENEEEEEESVE